MIRAIRHMAFVLSLAVGGSACNSFSRPTIPTRSQNIQCNSFSRVRSTVHFNTASEAIRHIMDRHPDMRLLLLGDPHRRRSSSCSSALEVTASQIMPEIVERGRQNGWWADWVAEPLISDWRVLSDLNEFCETNEAGSELRSRYGHQHDYHGIMEFFRESCRQGVNLHAAFPDLEGRYLSREEVGRSVRTLIESRILSLVELDPEIRLVAYVGAEHNDFCPISRGRSDDNDYTIIGRSSRIRQVWGGEGQIVEVDLLDADLQRPGSGIEDFTNISNWRDLYPQNGVNVVEVEGSPRYLILFGAENFGGGFSPPPMCHF